MRIFSFLFSISLLISSSVFAMTPEEGLERLMQGNARYVKDKLEHPDRTSERRESLINKQQPYAIILGCSDSRVAPEILFDQGVGDLFVVRVAGNVAGPIEVDSIEYSAKYLGSCIIVVLGHENCGAVSAVLQGQTADIEAVATKILPALTSCKVNQNPLQSCIKANVQNVVTQLISYPKIKDLMQQKKIKVVGGYYSLSTGKVEILP